MAQWLGDPRTGTLWNQWPSSLSPRDSEPPCAGRPRPAARASVSQLRPVLTLGPPGSASALTWAPGARPCRPLLGEQKQDLKAWLHRTAVEPRPWPAEGTVLTPALEPPKPSPHPRPVPSPRTSLEPLQIIPERNGPPRLQAGSELPQRTSRGADPSAPSIRGTERGVPNPPLPSACPPSPRPHPPTLLGSPASPQFLHPSHPRPVGRRP